MNDVYLIERVEIDTLENRLEKAVYYEKMGIVFSEEEMQALVEQAGMVSAQMHPWPCQYVNGGKDFPKIRATRLPVIRNTAIKEP